MATTFDSTKNFVYSTVLTAPSPASSGTTLSVQVADGANFPDPASVNDYNLVVFPAGTQPTSTNAEIVRVTAKSSNQLTITREQEGTSARNILVGDQVILAPTAKTIDDITTALNTVETWKESITASVAEINKLDGVTASTAEINQVDGITVVSTDGTQTLTNKVLSTGVELDANADPNITYYGMARQAIRNGNGDVWQRGTSFTSATTPANNDDTYLVDGWNLISDGNDVVDVSRETVTDLAGSTYAIKLDIETSKRCGIVQFLESVDAVKFKGKKVSVSFAVKSANIAALRCAVLSWGGTADSLTSDVVGTWGATPTWATNWTAENTPTDLTVTSGWTTVKVENIDIDSATVNNLAFAIWTPNEETIGDIVYITQIEMNMGSASLHFQPKSFEEELGACRRHCVVLLGSEPNATDAYRPLPAVCIGVSGTVAQAMVSFPVVLRAEPTLTVTANQWRIADGTGAVALTGITITSVQGGTSACILDLIAASGITPYRPYFIQQNNSASASIIFSAEL